MVLMHGVFDLRDGVTEDAFHKAFRGLADRLQQQELALASRCMRYQPHDGYNSHPPMGQRYVAIEFADMDAADRCWTHIEQAGDPVQSLHSAVFSKIRNYRFFLTVDA